MVFAAVAAVICVAAAAAVFFGGGKEDCRSIQIVELEGEVSIERESLGNMAAFVNMNLISGDRISTSEGAYVVLRLDDDKFIMLGEQGAIRVTASGDAADSRTEIYLETGTVVNDLQNPLNENSSYEVVTPSVNMSVRGTVFEARRNKDDVGELLVYEGIVVLMLKNGESITYTGGEYAQFEAGDTPTPQLLVERETITYERMNLQMISFLLQIRDTGRALYFGDWDLDQSTELAREEEQTEGEEPIQTTQEPAETAAPDTEAPSASPAAPDATPRPTIAPASGEVPQPPETTWSPPRRASAPSPEATNTPSPSPDTTQTGNNTYSG